MRKFLLSTLTLASFASVGFGAASPVTVAVIPFAAREGQAQAWLSKGLADMTIRQLAEVPSLAILEREHLQAFIKEMELGQAPLFDQTQALRVGRVARVQQIVYGNYKLAGDRIEISAFLLDLGQQKVLSTAEASGPMKNLVALTQGLTQELIQKRGITLTAADRARLQIKVTDSIPALEHFYRGIDAYDHGAYADAWGEFFAATQQDTGYLDARLWTGKMYEAKGDHEHAVLTYKALYRDAPQAIQSLDALFFAKEYHTLTQVAPDSPEGLEAAFHLGQALEKKKDITGAYRAYRFLEKFKVRVETDGRQDYRTRYPKSPFFSWDHALGLYPEALAHAVLLYAQLVNGPDGKKLESPRGVFLLDPAHPVLEEAFQKTPSFFKNRINNPKWIEETYAVVVPDGYVATGVTMEITGRLFVSATDRDFTMRIYPFPLPRDPQQGWIGVLYGQTPTVQTVRKTITFHGENRNVFALQLFTSDGEILRWKLAVRVKPIKEAGRPLTQRPAQVAGFWEGQILGDIPLPPETRTGATRDLTQAFYQPQRDMALAADRTGRLHLVTMVGELDSADVDLWTASGTGEGNWTELTPLPINSRGMDWNPRLFKGEDGLLRLAWNSNRRGLGWELWMSQRDAQGGWSPAWRVPLEKFASPEPQPSEEVSKLLDFDLFQDRRGRWLIPYYSAVKSQVVVLASRDLKNWEVHATLPVAGRIYGFSVAQDAAERYVLAGWAESGELRVWNSNDGKAWAEKALSYNTRYAPGHRVELRQAGTGRVLWLTAGKQAGPRIGWWQLPENVSNMTVPVVRTHLESATAVWLPGHTYAVALREQDRIRVRMYKKFVPSAGRRESEYDGFVQREIESDPEGNVWIRAFPGIKFIVPDVTSVGVEPPQPGEKDPRIWFGIETGIFFHQGKEFQKTDVSQGFFDHFVTDIQSCPGLPVYFASRERQEPLLGTAEDNGSGHRFSATAIPGAKGAIMGLACGEKPGAVYVDTSAGETWKGHGGQWVRASREQGPMAKRKALLAQIKDPVYKSIGPIAKDPVKGFWYLPADDTFCKGVVYFDGQTHKIYNPPHDILQKPSGLAVDHQGGVWIGTWFNGLYKLERKK